MTAALIGLGSNAGEAASYLEQALQRLADDPRIDLLRQSSFHGTKAAGGPAQDDYLNAATIVETELSPTALLAFLQQIETDMGRERSVRWGPRTIDLDLLLFDSQELQTPALVIPHPRMAFRRFVLAPAAEIAADWIYPINGWSIAQLCQHLDDSPRAIAIIGSPQFAELVQIISQERPGWQFFDHWQEDEDYRLIVVTSPPQADERWLKEFDHRRRQPTSPPVLWLPQTTFAWLTQEVLAALTAME